MKNVNIGITWKGENSALNVKKEATHPKKEFFFYKMNTESE